MMTDLTLSEFEWCKDARTLDEALLKEARDLLGADWSKQENASCEREKLSEPASD